MIVEREESDGFERISGRGELRSRRRLGESGSPRQGESSGRARFKGEEEDAAVTETAGVARRRGEERVPESSRSSSKTFGRDLLPERRGRGVVGRPPVAFFGVEGADLRMGDAGGGMSSSAVFLSGLKTPLFCFELEARGAAGRAGEARDEGLAGETDAVGSRLICNP